MPVLRERVSGARPRVPALRHPPRERALPSLLHAPAPGAFACARCRQAMELELLLDATDAASHAARIRERVGVWAALLRMILFG